MAEKDALLGAQDRERRGSARALAYDALGGRDAGAPWADYRLTSRALTIAGGTSQINKNITAQRVLGLPRK